MELKTVFTVDEAMASVYVMCIYPASVPTVWKFFTESQYLEQWWAPQPWKCETVTMDFRPEGAWRYVMVSPEGEKHYGTARYHEIKAGRSFDCTDFFTDEAGNKIMEMPEANWLYGFTGVDEGTKVTINIHFSTAGELRQILDMGFEEGLKMGLNQLGTILSRER